jgi:5-methylcytosine-specific restriction endonuclease McrA
MFEYRPYPKSQQLKKPGKKEKRLEVYKGRTIPSKRQRGKVTKKEYNRAIEANGDACLVCGSKQIEMHHVLFRSKGGRGTWRNLIPLCPEHHRGKTGVHQNKGLMLHFQKRQRELYGPYYHCDKWDLYKAGLIPNTTDKAFEEFFEK